MNISFVPSFDMYRKYDVYDRPVDYIYVQGRRVGNTTRIIDATIQFLLKGYAVKVIDHHNDGRAHKHLLEKIITRLSFEHDWAKLDVNKQEFIIAISNLPDVSRTTKD